jgi:hypothetical protein
MVMATQKRLLFRPYRLGLALVLPVCCGCFETQPVDTRGVQVVWPLTRTIDDFESGNGLPSWTLLGSWGCNAWPAETSAAECGVAEPGSGDAGLAGSLSFDLTRESGDDGLGAQIYSFRRSIPLDLSRYHGFGFSANLEPRDDQLISNQVLLRVRLDCPAAATVGVSPQGERVVLTSAVRPPADGAWHRFELDLNAFTQPAWQQGRTGDGFEWERIDRERCLAAVDSLGLSIEDADLEGAVEGAPAMAGRLMVDEIDLYEMDAEQRSVEGGLNFSGWSCRERPEAGGLRECDLRRAPSMSFTMQGNDRGQDSPSVVLCTHAHRLDQTTHEVTADTRDLTAFESLSFGAQFMPDAPESIRRFTVRLGCRELVPSSLPALQREVELSAERSSYTLPLESFTPSPYPLGFDNVEGCLARMDELCFETQVQDGELASGTLAIDEVVLR